MILTAPNPPSGQRAIAGGSAVARIIVPLIGALVLLAVLRVVRTSPWAGAAVWAAAGDTAPGDGQGTGALAPGTDDLSHAATSVSETERPRDAA